MFNLIIFGVFDTGYESGNPKFHGLFGRVTRFFRISVMGRVRVISLELGGRSRTNFM